MIDQNSIAVSKTDKQIKNTQLMNKALWLAVLTVAYNLIEGIVSVYFGAEDEALTLFGFGMDSFIETISALGILNMTLRMRNNSSQDRSPLEIIALNITGWCFYALSLILAAGAVFNLISGRHPQTTIAGIIIACISIVTMWLLVWIKRDVGKKLHSKAIIADANCNLVCIYMSVVLLVSSLLYEFSGLAYFDALGAVGLIWFSVKEGKESFEKARGEACSCHD
jgi:predicted Co/Zn/Cd cation transporter (cation efflux family)